LAWFTFAAAIAVRRSSIESPAEAAALGFTCTRTAGRCPPERVTRPTPATCEIFCARRVSTRFCTWGIFIVFEVMPIVMIGASAGFTFE
jgi:hypothetical protein